MSDDPIISDADYLHRMAETSRAAIGHTREGRIHADRLDGIARSLSQGQRGAMSESQLATLCAALGWQGGTYWQVVDEIRTRAVYAGLLHSALKKAYNELNIIHARDGVPYTRDGWKSSVTQEYFTSVVEECRDALEKVTAGEDSTSEIPVARGECAQSTPSAEQRLWLWKNFVDGRPEYWAFDNGFPVHDNGDPQTLGEPCGYAILKPSRNGRPDVSFAAILRRCQNAKPTR